jgi:hypothetical protein
MFGVHKHFDVTFVALNNSPIKKNSDLPFIGYEHIFVFCFFLSLTMFIHVAHGMVG